MTARTPGEKRGLGIPPTDASRPGGTATSIVSMTAENVSGIIEGHEVVLIDFMKPGCPPCVGFEPIYEDASRKHPDLLFSRVDITREEALAKEFEIDSIPTLVIFRERVQLAAQPGMISAEVLEDLIGRALALDMAKVRRDIEAEQQTGATE